MPCLTNALAGELGQGHRDSICPIWEMRIQ